MENQLLDEEKKQLLAIAREAIVTYITTGKLPHHEVTDEHLLEKRGCFVTIKMGGTLRGCIGNFVSEKPLYKLVQEMAIAAATKDVRFYPMKAADLDSFSLEISALTPLQKISSIDEITVGVHGLFMEKNFSRGVLLPQVATEHGWDKETFLAQTCTKAGLKKEDWKEGTDIYIFSAEVFHE